MANWPDPPLSKGALAPGAMPSLDGMNLGAGVSPLTRQMLLQAIAQMPAGFSLFDKQNRLIYVNQAFRQIWALPDELLQPGAAFKSLVRAIAGHEVLVAPPGAEVVEPASRHPAMREWLLDDGRSIAINMTRLPDGTVLGLHQDVTETRTHQREQAHWARHDVLTGLPNRHALMSALGQALPRTGRGEEIAVVCLNLDRFKDVNDTLGHRAGDALLKQVAARLRHCVRQSDVAGRLGGDDFMVIQVGRPQPASATSLSRRLIEALSQPYDIDGQPALISVCVGVAVAPFDGEDAELLVKNAALALHRAKDEGRGLLRYFEPGMDQRLQARRQIEMDLREALDLQQFDLAFQPLVSMRDGSVAGVEALIRWVHPLRGRIPPLDFIPLAEETGLIIPIGRWVLDRACSLAAQWPDSVRVAVNVSPVQFRSNTLVQDVMHALDNAKLAPNRLELEITEAVLMRDSAHAVSMLRTLRELGVRISMDDFGTGFSSLSYLRQFPLDKIKIDRSFVQGVDSSVQALAIVKSIRHLAAALGMSTTVEGVETPEQLRAIALAGCDDVQGYVFSQPRPAGDIAALIANGFSSKMPAR